MVCTSISTSVYPGIKLMNRALAVSSEPRNLACLPANISREGLRSHHGLVNFLLQCDSPDSGRHRLYKLSLSTGSSCYLGIISPWCYLTIVPQFLRYEDSEVSVLCSPYPTEWLMITYTPASGNNWFITGPIVSPRFRQFAIVLKSYTAVSCCSQTMLRVQ